MSWTSKRIIFIIFNSIFFVLGLVVIGIGIYSRTQINNFKDILNDDSIFQPSNVIMAAGLFVGIIGFLGCWGALKSNGPCIIVYTTLIMLIVVLEIAASVYTFTKKDVIKTKFEKGIKDVITQSYGQTNAAAKALTVSIDWLQETLKCCGSVQPRDWKASNWYKEQSGKTPSNTSIVPTSCCVTEATGCNKGNSTSLKIHKTGCIVKGRKLLEGNLQFIAAVGVIIGIIEILLMVYAIFLWKEFKAEKCNKNGKEEIELLT